MAVYIAIAMWIGIFSLRVTRWLWEVVIVIGAGVFVFIRIGLRKSWLRCNFFLKLNIFAF